ncbi:hypothetical protein PIB30_076298 [Stylosanthes scabra]|uniref:GRF-type domain-containing protein n=1 Tax=Stylosanthes scabra TaxID=79078 RepID=A0ABU6YMS0_9FABA|nr:hypothetical protein [Stylosanthes scabra]
MSYRGKKRAQDSAGSGNSSSSGDRFCDCGLKTPLQVSRSAANPGREYYSCPAGRCRWFMWTGPALKCSVRRGSQSVELDAEDNKANLGNNFGLLERVGKIQNDCFMLKMLACMNLLGFVFCMFFILVLLFKV